MLVEELLRRLRELLSSAPVKSDPGVDEEISKLFAAMSHFGTSSVDDFIPFLAVAKLPARRATKSSADLERVRLEKEAKKVEAARLKTEAKRRAEAEIIAKKAEGARLKSEHKARAAEAKRQKTLLAAQEKLAAKHRVEEANKLRKEQEVQQLRDTESQALRASIDELRNLLLRFRGGNVPKDAVDSPLDKLKSRSAIQLLDIAKALNADATLTEKSTKQKILKQITAMVLRVWKTSDNVHH